MIKKPVAPSTTEYQESGKINWQNPMLDTRFETKNQSKLWLSTMKHCNDWNDEADNQRDKHLEEDLANGMQIIDVKIMAMQEAQITTWEMQVEALWGNIKVDALCGTITREDQLL